MKIEDYSLYLVITEEYGKGRDALEIAESAVKGGVDIIQMREKNKPGAELIELGKRLSAFCREKKVIFIVNDDPLLAKEVDADGVHLGQEDLARHPLKETREAIGRDKIIGISTHSIEQFEQANGADVDYISFGPIFNTKAKDYSIGIGNINKVLDITKKPVFFIGGINLQNVSNILKEGAKNIALIRGVTEAEDIGRAVKYFKKILKKQRGMKCSWTKLRSQKLYWRRTTRNS